MTETVGTGAGSASGKGGEPTGGLTVRRVFTVEGEHPYDQVTWEQRDVVMTNWRDGTVNFEQRGVEFPEFWSVNATNIVTSKYFRGAVGTPAREHSLKQLIDRVVRTYGKAGRDHGYFATPADLEIFEHELTWMLLHQVFSFNSPVWFNVGTTSKQQVSACQPYDAMVSTPAGAVPIGRFVELNALGAKVYDAHGLTKVIATKANGTKEVLRISTKSGHRLDVTADHLVWRASSVGGRFVLAGELRVGDKLEWHRRAAFGEAEIDERSVAEAALAGREIRAGAQAAVLDGLHLAPLPVATAYLRSAFEVAGAVSEPGDVVELRLPAEPVAHGIHSLLARFGVFARIEREPDGEWAIRIQNAGDRRIFADEIGFTDPVKSARLDASFEKPGRLALDTERLEIADIESRGEMPVYDIQTESGEYLSGNLRVHNCFILAVDDTMESILNWYREEGLIFKGGSGAGLNLSRIRSSKELLTSGGTASGPVSFMRGADASAGTIKSGGATRRAAKMVVLDVDHPDVEEFIQTKAREEKKIRVLRDAGFDMDLSGADISSVQYQNANNSVRVSDEFMQAVETEGEFGLRARITGDVIERVDAKKLFRTMAQAAWECADPGIQYDGTINDWHTCPESGRITASNPCFPGDQRVVTDAGLVRIGDLVRRASMGESFAVYTNDVTHKDTPVSRVLATVPTRYMITGTNEIVELRFSDGSRLRCTPNHRVWTANQGWVHADQLTEADQVVRSVEHAPRPYAAAALPPLALQVANRVRGKALRAVPEKWDTELAHYVGWLVGDGRLTEQGAVTVYGTEWEREVLMPKHRALLAAITGFESKPNAQANGAVQLRARRSRFALMLRALGVSTGRSSEKVVPESIHVAPEDILTAFLRGLFDADGCVVNQEAKGNRYVGLGSRSEELLVGVQELLASLGVRGRIYRTGTKSESFEYTAKNGEERVYGSDGPSFDLRITGRHMAAFAELVGFDHADKSAQLAGILAACDFCEVDETVRLVSRVSQGFETTFNLTEPRNHSYIVGGTVVANCSEYMHLDNSSCNLASLNLLKFATADGGFDAPLFARAVEIVITAMDISICFADFPTEAIGDTTRKFRQLGIGYANLGALLMALGHAYDSEGGRALAASITSLMTGVSYRRSAELAEAVGPYEGYARNAEAHQRVMRKHAAASELVRTYHENDAAVRALATEEWKRGIEIGAVNGWRNAQASVLAPTGTIGFMLDCDTTGIEPDFSLVKFKKLVGGGSMQIVNQTVPRALTALGYQEEQVEAIVEYVAQHGHVVDAPGLRQEHYEVFDCAVGERSIAPMGHVRMMAAVQPFLSGAISKTVNMPESATVEDVEQIYFQGWKLGLKALAIYRDNCKVGQPLSTGKKEKAEPEKVVEHRPVRRRLPKKRPSQTVSFTVGGAEGYLHAGSYPDDGLGEIFVKLGKQGSTLAGVMDAFSMSISVGLQHGIPLEFYVSKFSNLRFEPAGMTDDPDIRIATSVMDYLFRRLALDYLPYETRSQMGILSADERTAEVEATYGGGDVDIEALRSTVDSSTPAPAAEPKQEVHSTAELMDLRLGKAADAPLCMTCGTKMRPAGSCYACEGCGATSGCS